jgi:quinohemoprotein ethanol dehydrogenase
MLRASPAPLDAVSFSAVVREGALVPNGMPRFEELDEAMLAALRQYPG